MLFKSNRKASQIFQNIGEDPEHFASNFKYTLPIKQVIQMKIKMKLSVKNYEIMRENVRDYLSLPCYTTLNKKIRQ